MRVERRVEYACNVLAFQRVAQGTSFCFPWFAILMGSQNTWDATEHNILCDPARWGGFSSVAQSCLTLQPHGLQHSGPPCPSPTPRAYSNSCPLSQWCHPTISSSVVPFSSHLQSFPASGSFPMSQLTENSRTLFGLKKTSGTDCGAVRRKERGREMGDGEPWEGDQRALRQQIG